MFRRNIQLLIVLVAIILVAAGCGKTNTVAPQPGGPLIINLAGGDNGFPTPYRHYSRGPGTAKMQLIFDSLLERGERGYVPWLAEKWSISADGMQYRFTIRKNVKWHDGKPLTAADVKFSFDYFKRFPPGSAEMLIAGKSLVQSVEVLDPQTVVINVSAANATALGKLGQVRIIPRHIWEKVSDPQKYDAPDAVIGCGPYMLKEYNRELGAYKYIAFKEFWGPKPLIDVLQFIPVSDGILAFNKGEIDLVGVPPDLLRQYSNKPEFKVRQNPAVWGYSLTFNMERRPELRDKKLRQAFAYAIDRQELVDKVARGAGKVASMGYLPEGHIWRNPNLPAYLPDSAKAKALLGGQNLTFSLLASSSPDELRIAELIKIACEKAGIKLVIRSVDGKTRDAAAKKQDYDILLNGGGGWGGDADLLRTLYASRNSSADAGRGIPGYQNPVIDQLSERQVKELDPEKRRVIVFELQTAIAEEVPRLPLYNTAGYIVYRPERYADWRYMFDHHEVTHNKLSFVDWKEP